jgi:PHP family Zn ribbon phosphoesterase
VEFITDLHLHSKYSRAVSPQMVLSQMAKWAVKKGINLLTTGDFNHPLWFKSIKAELEEEGGGIYKLKMNNGQLAANNVRFVLTTEIFQHL